MKKEKRKAARLLIIFLWLLIGISLGSINAKAMYIFVRVSFFCFGVFLFITTDGLWCTFLEIFMWDRCQTELWKIISAKWFRYLLGSAFIIGSILFD